MGQGEEASRDPLPGMVVNAKFRVIRVLAHGGMGKIYQAEQVPLGRPVALKVLRTRYADEIVDDPQFQKRFFLEASILAKLQHANIVTLYDYGRIEGVAGEQYFMAMEMLRGETLQKRIRTAGALRPLDALRIARQIARGLMAAHRLGVVHRDLKPSNIMIAPEDDGDEVVKILDFGIGKMVADGSEDLTADGAFVGSPRYMAPEQINNGRIDARTDVYALGVIMYECFAGRPPFEGETNIATMMAHCNQAVPPMRERASALVVPTRVERMVMHCLAKAPEARPQSMDELAREIAACEAELGGITSGVVSAPLPPTLPTPRHGDGVSGNGVPTLGGVTPMPTSGGSSSGGGRVSNPAAHSGTGTHRSLTRSWMPPTPQPAPGNNRRAGALMVVAAALMAIAAVATTVALVRGRADERSAAMPASAATLSAPTSFVLTLESEPEGAQVLEGDVAAPIGVTPLPITIDRAAARAAQKRFVLRLEGYAPYTIFQADSDDDVHKSATLVPSAPTAVASADAPPVAASAAPHAALRPPPATAKTAATSAPPPRNPDLDIKLKR